MDSRDVGDDLTLTPSGDIAFVEGREDLRDSIRRRLEGLVALTSESDIRAMVARLGGECEVSTGPSATVTLWGLDNEGMQQLRNMVPAYVRLVEGRPGAAPSLRSPLIGFLDRWFRRHDFRTATGRDLVWLASMAGVPPQPYQRAAIRELRRRPRHTAADTTSPGLARLDAVEREVRERAESEAYWASRPGWPPTEGWK